MTTVRQNKAELEMQLRDQLQLLKSLTRVYDEGNTVAAKSIATCVRVLVHNTSKSHALLSQLDQQDIMFFDSIGSENEVIEQEKSQRIGSYYGLVGAGVGKNVYVPYLDDVVPDFVKYVPFDEYWNRVIFIDSKNNSFTRKDIILAVSNTDGGAHVDPNLDEKYVELSRKNSMGISSGMNNNLKPLEGAELAAVRQIGHEIIRTLDSGYLHQKMRTHGSLAVMGGGFVAMKDSAPKLSFAQNKKVGRNDPCPCKSGLKYKKCCGY